MSNSRTGHSPLASARSALAAAALCGMLAFSPAASAQTDAEMAQIEKIQSFLGVMQSFFGIIESMHSVSDDPERAAIFYMHKIQETYEDKGQKGQAAGVFREVIEKSDSATVRAAATLMLGDLLKESGQYDEAIGVLRQGLAESVRSAR